MHQPSAVSTKIFFPSNQFFFGNYGLRRAERGEDMPSETSEGVEN